MKRMSELEVSSSIARDVAVVICWRKRESSSLSAIVLAPKRMPTEALLRRMRVEPSLFVQTAGVDGGREISRVGGQAARTKVMPARERIKAAKRA